ncbi:phosphatidylglycerol lysyltransferase domain-containing protein [Serratia marcescens]|uniref:phosphatidylglycerol lysyltransferase domain-containing protein n=1 Tax=Serratia marcescens TaxID=615 RepID=UPI0039EAFEBF
MDAVNSFETRNTRIMVRGEYGFLFLASVFFTLYHWQEVRLIPLILLFSYIDLIGYVPGAIAYRVHKGKVPEVYYVLYNITHNFVTAALVALAWCYFVRVEWALMGILIHLFGDRSLFGNEFKSRCMSFEPKKNTLFRRFETLLAQSRRLASPEMDPTRQLMLTERFGDHPSLFLAMNRKISTFCADGIIGYVPYQDDGRCLFILTGVVSREDERGVLLQHFIRFAQENHRDVCAVQLQKNQAELFSTCGFQVNQMGCSYTLDLMAHTIVGTEFMSLRNKISRAKKAGVTVHELGVDLPLGPEQRRMLEEITTVWLAEKGNKKLLSFMVGELNASTLDKERIFVAIKDAHIIGFISYAPSFGEYQGWMHDLTRRLVNIPPGTMELINRHAIERFKSEGVRYLSFGFTPFYGVTESEDAFEPKSKLLSRIIKWLEKYGQRIYPARSQIAYKQKWQPMTVSPEYFAVYKRFRLSHLIRLMKLSNAL